MSNDLMDQLSELKPLGDALIEKISRELCEYMQLDPDAIHPVYIEGEPEYRVWEEQAATVEQIMRILASMPTRQFDIGVWASIIDIEKEIEEKIND